MPLLALTTPEYAQAQLVAAVVLGAAGVGLLLPKPKHRHIAAGGFLVFAAGLSLAAYLVTAFGNPTQDLIGSILFWLFSAGAVGFGVVLVAQRNPARGALAFAFVILSSCGLFLLLAAPFLMAATVIIYAGAIVVTFLFVLMLSHSGGGPSDENDRSRDPLLSSLAGFGFAGLVLFAMYQTANAEAGAPPIPLTQTDREGLIEVFAALQRADAASTRDDVQKEVDAARTKLGDIVGPAVEPTRLTVQDRFIRAGADIQTSTVLKQAMALSERGRKALDEAENKLMARPVDLDGAKAELRGLRDEVAIFSGVGQLPARNVAPLGYLLYSEHLLAVEMAGTLLLVATIGAVAIARRRGATT